MVPGPVAAPAGISDPWLRHNTATAVRVLAAAGPMTVEALQEAVGGTHTRRHTPVPTPTHLMLGLGRVGAHLDAVTGLWSATSGAVPQPRDAALLQSTLPGAVYTRGELAEVLRTVGYAASSAGGARIDGHPLITKLDPNRYRILRCDL